MTLRARLTIVAAFAVAIAVALGAFAAYTVVSHELHGQIDASLRQPGEFLREGPSRLSQDFRRPPGTPALRGDERYVQLVFADGTLERPVYQQSLPVDTQDVAVAAGQGAPFLRDAEVGGVHVRMITQPIADGAALQIARPLTDVDHALGRLRIALLLVSLGGIALAAVLGLVVSRAALRPVGQLTRAVEHITETDDLSSPIDVHGRDEVARLARSFNGMLASLDASRSQQRQLVEDASHELRTPLTSLRTNIEVLAAQPDMPAAERGPLLRDVTAQLAELGALVDDLLELAREERNPFEDELSTLRLDEVVAWAVDRTRRHAPGLEVDARLETAEVRGHRGLLERLFANLLDNASKWSPPGGSIEVEMSGGDVTVRDHGPGIADADREHVFDRFYRSPDARSTAGSGLGLAIVRRIVETHEGQVGVEAPPGGGTLVRVRLPLAGGRAEGPTSPPDATLHGADRPSPPDPAPGPVRPAVRP